MSAEARLGRAMVAAQLRLNTLGWVTVNDIVDDDRPRVRTRLTAPWCRGESPASARMLTVATTRHVGRNLVAFVLGLGGVDHTPARIAQAVLECLCDEARRPAEHLGAEGMDAAATSLGCRLERVPGDARWRAVSIADACTVAWGDSKALALAALAALRDADALALAAVRLAQRTNLAETLPAPPIAGEVT